MQETTAPGSRELELIYVTSTVFLNFPVKIPVSSKMLFANQENHFVDKLTFFEKVLAFWIKLVQLEQFYAQMWYVG